MQELLRVAVSLSFIFAAFVACFALPAHGEEPEVAIDYREQVTAFFAEAEASFTFDISSTTAFDGVASWVLVANGRVLASGQSSVQAALDKPAQVHIRRKLPAINDGIVFPLQLKIRCAADDAKDPAAERVLDVWLFSENPFADRQNLLESLEIRLFDPPGDTAAVFDKQGIPVQPLNNVDALSELSQGVVVIGEGTSLKDYPSLGKTLPQLAARGVGVICLAPSDGELLLPVEPGDDAPQAAEISLRRAAVVAQLDKRLGSSRWIPDESPVLRELRVLATSDRVIGEVVEPGKGWPWLEVHYAKPPGRFVYCGLGVIRDWDKSPIPSYLLLNLLESLPRSASASKHPQD